MNLDTHAVTVLIADQNSAFCLAASRFISALPGYEVVSRPLAPNEVMPACASFKPDIVLMSFAFCSRFANIDLVRRLKALIDRPQIILVAPVDDPAYVEHSVKMGADGCIARERLEFVLPALMEKLCEFCVVR